MVRIKGEEQASTISAIQNLYGTYNPGFPFEYGFLDEAYQKQYLTENRVGILSRYFAGLAILISCLGLFGLATFTAQKRQKEIGIRKVVGASVNSIVFMLSKDFLKLVLLAVVIAFPLAWWLMSEWLQGFAYRIKIGLEVFLIHRCIGCFDHTAYDQCAGHSGGPGESGNQPSLRVSSRYEFQPAFKSEPRQEIRAFIRGELLICLHFRITISHRLDW